VLESTFLHVPGLGADLERSLWEQGCLSWRDLAEGLDRYSYSPIERAALKRAIDKSFKSLDKRDGSYFRKKLGVRESWRALPEFKDSCLYLDIETDGGSSASSVTMIGMYDGVEFTCLVKGKDLDAFPDIVAKYGLIVTFAGGSFDLPVLQKRFFGLRFNQIHIDLCPTMHRLGLRGGLKSIERQLGVSRCEEAEGMTGRDAIRLWRRYIMLGDDEALEALIKYNREDVVNLEYLAQYAYDNLRKQIFPEASHQAQARLPFL
jgi:uncharacterized protein YprB with RNaseH-like and TPR domain